ncbi:MAG: YbaN family protein [Candidatus Marinimicrobia bacterium]|nr:YbaN family protein [Candidatus Neomarinimicrobiota bacterium]
MTLGMFFVGLGFVGVFIPGIPTTPSILAAAWFFARSSKRFEYWLLNHKIFGQIIKDWQQNGGIAKKSKINAVILIIPTFALTIYLSSSKVLAISLFFFAVILCFFIITRPEPDSIKSNG